MIDLGIGNLRIKKVGESGIYALFKEEDFVSPLTNLEEHLASMIEELKQRLAEAESRVCKWQEDSDADNNLWNGECGTVWEFIADGPHKASTKYISQKNILTVSFASAEAGLLL